MKLDWAIKGVNVTWIIGGAKSYTTRIKHSVIKVSLTSHLSVVSWVFTLGKGEHDAFPMPHTRKKIVRNKKEKKKKKKKMRNKKKKKEKKMRNKKKKKKNFEIPVSFL